MRDRQDHANDAPRRALDHAQAGLVGARIAAHGLHSKHIAHILQLENLVIEAADFGFFHLHAAQLFAAVVADAADDIDHAAALRQAHGCYFLLSLVRSVDGLIDGREDSVLRG